MCHEKQRKELQLGSSLELSSVQKVWSMVAQFIMTIVFQIGHFPVVVRRVKARKFMG